MPLWVFLYYLLKQYHLQYHQESTQMEALKAFLQGLLCEGYFLPGKIISREA